MNAMQESRNAFSHSYYFHSADKIELVRQDFYLKSLERRQMETNYFSERVVNPR
jgi:hypothetical protein